MLVVGLVLLLVVLAGVIAFLGDRLGTFVGRHRMSLFGARPRVTGQIVGVFAGILIMLTTLGVLALANRTATATLLNAQRAAAELTELRAEQRVLQSMIRELERDLEDGATQLDDARGELESVTAQRDAARRELEEVAGLLDELASEQSLLEQELTGLRDSMGEVQVVLDEVQIRLQMAQQQLELAAQRQAIAENDAAQAQAVAAAAEAQVTELQAETSQLEELIADLNSSIAELDALAVQLREDGELLRGENEALTARNDELAQSNTQLLAQNELLSEVNATLRQRFDDSNARVQQLEVNLQVLELEMEDSSRRLSELQSELEQIAQGEITYRTGDLIYSGRIRADGLPAAREALAAFVRAANVITAQRGAGEILLSTEQFDSLASVVAESDDELIIALISPRNQLRSAVVEVSVEAYENTQVLGAGQLIASRRIHLGTPDQPASQTDVRSAVLDLVQDSRSRLTTAGFFSQEAPRFSESEDSFAAQLQRLSGAAAIGVVTREPVFRGGPAVLEFVILN